MKKGEVMSNFNKYEGFFSLTNYLYIYGEMEGLKNLEIISRDKIVNHYKLKEFVSILTNKYNTEEIKKSLKDAYEGRYIYNFQDLKESHSELYRFIMRYNTKKSYENILIKLLYRNLIKEDISIVEFTGILNKELSEEYCYTHSFCNSLDFVMDNVDINLLLRNEEKSKQKNIKMEYIKKETSSEFPLFLGEKTIENKTIFKKEIKKEKLKLSKKELLENVYILGASGSGLSEALISILSSLKQNNIDFTYFDNSSDNTNHFNIKSMFNQLCSLNDFFVFNNKCIELLDSSIFNEKKSAYVFNPIQNKNNKEILVDNKNVIFKHLEKMIDCYNQNNEHVIIVNETDSWSQNDWVLFDNLIPKLNAKNIFVILSDIGLWRLSNEKKIVIDKFKNHIIMKSESTITQKYYKMDTKNLNSGDFIYLYNKKIVKNGLSFLYLNCLQLDYSLLNIP